MKKKGFTLSELLIVVAIIAVLVAVSIPIFAAQLHKARVATDWANIRAYFSEIQGDYISTGVQNPNVPVISSTYDWTSITFLNGQKVKLKAGLCAVQFHTGSGYEIRYDCNNVDSECTLLLPAN